MERGAVDTGQKTRRAAMPSDEGREPVRAPERGSRPVQNHVLVDAAREAVDRVADRVRGGRA